jgi:hypothetical protein
VTNGFIVLTNQPALDQLGNWEPYTGVLGDSTFLIGFSTYASDGTYANQNMVFAKQPAAGGPASIGYEFYDDSGSPFMQQINLSRQNGNPERIAGDMRYGATKVISEAEVSIGQLAPFQTVSRWGNNNIYQGTDRYAAEQLFSLNPLTLVQTPVTNAWDYVYGPFVGSMGAANNAPQCSRTGGRPNFLDNGNIVVMIDDKTAITSSAGEVTTFAIIGPNGNVIKGPTLVEATDIWDNMSAYRGGFVIRCHTRLYFFDNTGTLQHSNDVNVSSGLAYGTGRNDSTRVGSDIRSHYVYVAGRVPDAANGPVYVSAWDAQTGNFIASALVTDGDPAKQVSDRVMVTADALDRICVVYPYTPEPAAFPQQITARVLQFDGSQFSYLTHSFYAFVNSVSDPSTALASGINWASGDPNVAMTPRQICVAAKGTINNINDPSAGANSQSQQTVYTVLSHPAPVAAPRPNMTVTRSGGNAVISWQQDAGLFVLQSAAPLSPPSTWSDVSPQPATVGPVNGSYSMTVPISAGNKFFRLIRRW